MKTFKEWIELNDSDCLEEWKKYVLPIVAAGGLAGVFGSNFAHDSEKGSNEPTVNVQKERSNRRGIPGGWGVSAGAAVAAGILANKNKSKKQG